MRGIIIFFLLAANVTAQDIFIIDSITNAPIENVSITNQSNGISSNVNGVANITIFNNIDTLIINHISYNKKKIIKSKVKQMILLSPKTILLPAVILKENPKTYNFPDYLMVKEVSQKSSASKSTAELLQINTSVTVQESQAGGGSPNFRGMEANRLLLVVDGLTLNNTIYRSGHLQNSSTINPFFIQSFSLATGPASINFGDGALGSALIFNTVYPVFETKSNHSFHQQYESSSNAVTLNYKANYSRKNIAFVSGLSIKSIGNLRMGGNRKHNYLMWGNEDIITKNNEQLNTNYDQADFIHKTLFKINKTTDLLLNTQYSTSSKIRRFDKLNDMIEGRQKYTDWYYGPQNRFLQMIKLNSIKSSLFYDRFQALFAFQDVSESRHYKKHNDSFVSNRYENVDLYDGSINFSKRIFSSQLSYGVGSRRQIVSSSANKELINGGYSYNTTRYPDGGSNVTDFFVYNQISLSVSDKLKLYLGGRLNYNELTAFFTDTQTYNFPFSEIKNKNHSLAKSVLINYKITPYFMLNASAYSGFRNPNLDDIGKVFSKNDNYVIIPNSNLSSEKSKNIELGVKCIINNIRIDFQFFNTIIDNAISRENGTLNGEDSIWYDGEMMKIQMNKNIESANINGLSFNGSYALNKSLHVNSNFNYTLGKTKASLPLAHIPPLNASFNIEYTIKKNNLKLSSKYNGWKKSQDYDLAGVDNLEEATIDGNPSWHTLSVYYSYKLDDLFTCGFGVKNIFDVHYKTFGSALSASGRNFVLSLHSNF